MAIQLYDIKFIEHYLIIAAYYITTGLTEKNSLYPPGFPLFLLFQLHITSQSSVCLDNDVVFLCRSFSYMIL